MNSIKFLLVFVFTNIIQSYAQNSQDSQFANNNSGITDEQFNSFQFGSEEFKFAFIGDSGSEHEAKKVMELTNFDALLHLGDFDYSCSTDSYFKNILDSERSYQFMGVLGNHEGTRECGTDKSKRFLNNVYNEMTSPKNDKVNCEFSSSKYMWTCVYKNMRIVGLTPGIYGADKRREQLSFLKKHLENAKEDWKICSWHLYDKYYHTGKYPSDGNLVSLDGESFYDYCREHGAIIMSAHDHVYARTHVMSHFKSPKIDKFDGDTSEDIVQIREGATLNILNGVGGWEIYIEQGEQKNYSHWQKKYARGSSSENAKKFGGLFCQFNYGGNNRKAYCELLRINSSNKVFDSFYIYRNDDPSTITYQQIDEAFQNEKIIAYKIENNIPLNEVDEKASEVNKKILHPKDKKGLFSTKNITIGCSICASLLLLTTSLIIYKKYHEYNRICMNEISDDELSNDSFHDGDQPNLYRASSIRGKSMKDSLMRGSSLRVNSLRSHSLRGNSLRGKLMKDSLMRGSSLRGSSLRGKEKETTTYYLTSPFMNQENDNTTKNAYCKMSPYVGNEVDDSFSPLPSVDGISLVDIDYRFKNDLFNQTHGISNESYMKNLNLLNDMKDKTLSINSLPQIVPHQKSLRDKDYFNRYST